jgi:type I restriction enzyme, S subunit
VILPGFKNLTTHRSVILDISVKLIFTQLCADHKKEAMHRLAWISSGGTPSRNNTVYFGGPIPWAKIKDLSIAGKWINDTEETITEEGLGHSSATLFPVGTVLFSIYGTIGKVSIVSRPLATNQAILGLVPKPSISSEYIYYALMFARESLFLQAQGTSQLNINGKMVKEFPIPLPPVEIIEHTTRFLRAIEAGEDLADVTVPRFMEKPKRLIGRAEVLLKKIDDMSSCKTRIEDVEILWSTILRKAFSGKSAPRNDKEKLPNFAYSRKNEEHVPQARHKIKQSTLISDSPAQILPDAWVWGKIADIALFVGSGITPRGGKANYISEGVPFIRSQNVLAGRLKLDDVVFISREQHETMSRTKVRPGDVLLNITGASIGRATPVRDYVSDANVNQHVCIIRPSSIMSDKFLSYFLNSPLGQDQIFAVQAGATREGLNYKQVRKLKMPTPPLTIQKVTVKRIEKLEAKIKELKQLQTQVEHGLEEFVPSALQKLLEGDSLQFCATIANMQ